MAYQTAAQAKSYFDLRAVAPVGWASLTDPQIGVYLEQASVRFDSLPWPSNFDTEAVRVANDVILGAFYEYTRALVEYQGTPPPGQRDRDETDEAFASFYDLPDAVFARLTTIFPEVSGIATARQATATTMVGDTAVAYDPNQETASQAAERFARAELIKAQTGEVLTEAEQVTQRPMRPMAISDGDAMPDTTAPGAGGLDTAAVTRAVKEEVADWAEQGNNDPIPASKLVNSTAVSSGLTATERGWLDKAVQADDDGINLDEREIVFTGADDTSEKRIEIPGLTVEDEGNIQGGANSVETINFVGAGVRVTQDAPNKRSVHITGTADGSGLSPAQVEALVSANESVQSHEQFEAAMRRETVLASAVSITIAADQVNLAQRIPGFPVVPVAGEDREFLIKVNNGLHYRFDNGVLLAKQSATTPTLLNDSDSVSYTESDTVFRIGHRTATREFVFAASVAGTYLVTLTDSQIDLKPQARRSSTEKWGLSDLDTTALDNRYAGVAEPDHGYQQPVDIAATITVTAQNAHGGANYGGNTDTGNVTFTIDSTIYTIRRIQGDSDDGGISVRLSTGGTVLLEDEKVKLEGYHLLMNDGSVLAFSRTRRSSDDTGSGISEYEWPSATTTALAVGLNTLQIYENLDRRNFVPTGTAEDNDDVLVRTPTGPEWRNFGRTSLEPMYPTDSGTGISPTALNRDGPQAALDLTDAKFDVDNSGLSGIVECEATLTFTTRSDTQFSFASDGIVTSLRVTSFFSLKDLRASTVWASGTRNGVEIGRWNIWRGSTDRVGRIYWMAARQSDGRIGTYLQYVSNQSSTTSGNCAVSLSRRLIFLHNDIAVGDGAAKGKKIAECTIPTGVLTAGQYQNINWTVEPEFTDDYYGGGGGLNVNNRCTMRPGWVLEGTVNGEIVSCSWIPSSALFAGPRSNTDVNYTQNYKVALSTQVTGTPARVYRAVNIQFQRELSQRQSDRDGFWIYGAGGAAIAANTKLEMYEWVGGKRGPAGEKGDQGEPGITVMINGVVQTGVRTINFRTS